MLFMLMSDASVCSDMNELRINTDGELKSHHPCARNTLFLPSIERKSLFAFVILCSLRSS